MPMIIIIATIVIILASAGLPQAGTKAELVERLVEKASATSYVCMQSCIDREERQRERDSERERERWTETD